MFFWFLSVFGASYSYNRVLFQEVKILVLVFFFKKAGLLGLGLKYINSYFLETLITLVVLLIPVAAYSLLDRKIMALVQRRKGPSLLGPLGILQFAVDGVKLLFKEVIFPFKASRR